LNVAQAHTTLEKTKRTSLQSKRGIMQSHLYTPRWMSFLINTSNTSTDSPSPTSPTKKSTH
jgi:hypothetical protein